MDWDIQESPVHFKSGAVGHLGAIHSFPEQKVLFRSDTKAPLSVRQSIAYKEKREAELKQMLQQAMGDASRAEFTNGYITWRKAKDNVGFDVVRLIKERPHLQAKYSLTKPGARRFLVS
jgi:hypothetical protein